MFLKGIAVGGWKTTGLLLALPAAAALLHLYGLIGAAGDRWPGKGTSESLTGRITEVEQEITRLNRQVEEFGDVRSRLRAVSDVAEKTSKIIPSGSHPNDLSGLIRSIATVFGVTIRRIEADIRHFPFSSLATGSDSTHSDTHNIHWIAWRFLLSLEGEYDQLAGFINCLEQLDQPHSSEKNMSLFFDITDVNISSSAPQHTGQPPRHFCTLTVQTYLPGQDESEPGQIPAEQVQANE